MNFAKFLRTPFVHITSGRLLLWTTTSETSNTKYLQVIKRSKFQEKNISCGRALNFDQRKTFSANYESMRVYYGLLTNLPRIVKFTDFSLSSFKLKRGVLPLLTKYLSNSETICHIKLNFFL